MTATESRRVLGGLWSKAVLRWVASRARRGGDWCVPMLVVVRFVVLASPLRAKLLEHSNYRCCSHDCDTGVVVLDPAHETSYLSKIVPFTTAVIIILQLSPNHVHVSCMTRGQFTFKRNLFKFFCLFCSFPFFKSSLSAPFPVIKDQSESFQFFEVEDAAVSHFYVHFTYLAGFPKKN